MTLTGSNFGTSATAGPGGLVSVTVGSRICTPVFVVVDHTSVTCIAPSGTGLAAAILVSVDGSSSASTMLFSYSAPTVANIRLPASNPTAGGATITIEGANFGATASLLSISVGRTSCSNTGLFVQHTSLACVVAAGVGKQLDVSVSVDTQTGTLAKSYFYDPPTVTSVSPGTGVTAGGFSVTIMGQNFGGASVHQSAHAKVDVAIGGSACTVFDISGPLPSHTSVVCSVAAGTGASKPVSITIQEARGATSSDRDQISSAASIFSYSSPSITSLSPRNGPTIGGFIIVFDGSNFGSNNAVVSVQLGSTSCPLAGSVSHTRITCTLPAGL